MTETNLKQPVNTEPMNRWFETTNTHGRRLSLYNTTFGQLSVGLTEDDTYNVYFTRWTDPDTRFGLTEPRHIKTGVKQRGRAIRIALNWHKKEFKQ